MTTNIKIYDRLELKAEFRSRNWVKISLYPSLIDLVLLRDGNFYILAEGRETIARMAIIKAWEYFISKNKELCNA